MTADVRAPEDGGASTLELFFDLVFVLGITQVAGLLASEPTAVGFLQGALLLAMLWWTWTPFAWTTNWTGTTDRTIRLSLLAAMGAILLMSLAVPDAFGDDGLLFAIPYFIVRMFGLVIYWLGARHHPAQRAALATFLPLAALAPTIALIGGFFPDPWRTWIWLLAMVVDVGGAISAGRGTFQLAPHHFAERHGLFVIIALGESIVAIGIGAVGAERDLELVVSLWVAFSGAAVVWWSYFDRAGPEAEAYLTRVVGKERSRFARDAYSFLHYPLILGIVLYAVAAEEMAAHSGVPFSDFGRFSLAAGLVLVLLAVVAGTYRAVRRVPYERLVAAVAIALLALGGGDLQALLLTGLAVGMVVLALAAESRRGSQAWTDRRSGEPKTEAPIPD